MRKILLMGNPNVGKSVIFSRLTGVDVIASNYPGTTVEFTRGRMKLEDELVEIIDVPGTYDLNPNSPAEEVAVRMGKQGDVIIDVVDATNLERNLNLTLQLLKDGKPVVVALNLWDETRHIGISIDVEKLQKILGVPVVPTCAITGEGIKELVSELPHARANTFQYEEEKRWEKVGEIISQVQRITHRHHTFLERMEDLSIRPVTGLPLAVITLFVIFQIIRFIGEGLIGLIFEPVFEKLWAPLMMQVSSLLGGGFIHDVLIGKLMEGQIDFVESLGLLTTGLFVPIAMVLPYVFSFYLVLSFLEDSGYLPRLAVLVDNVMHRFGLHGLAIIPMMLGLGCNVPGAMATRVLETKRERFIAATLMAIAVPCMAQTAMVAGLIGRYGAKGFGLVFGTLFVVWVVLGILLNRFSKGESPEIFVEIPPYRMPYWGALLKKLWMRIRGFLREAIPFVLFGVLVTNILYSLGIIQFLGRLTSPVITGVLGLPQDAVGALIIGFLRKDVAVGMLLPLGLDLSQLVVASVVLTMYFPCVATFAVLIKELGTKDMIKSAAIMISSALIVGGLLNLIL
ncbi:MAG: ferrous iron transporter B [candidate division Zixibacteria bacterium]|nr:ferrous iron transporter B [candidate division Zixibacteria bacterium]